MRTPLYRQLLCLPVLLAICLPALTQPAQKDSLRASFERYHAQTAEEKLFVHLAKTFYLGGEIIWFKLYDVDARSHIPLAASGIAYVEVLNKDQKPVLQEKIEIDSGTGHGSFRIPASISSGQYVFRAYTSWMKNFSPDFYYSQQLTILNTLNDMASSDSSRKEDYLVQFFPEGGNLVNGLTSVIAFKSMDQTGKGTPCQATILDQKNDTVARSQAGRFGMGKFTLTPLSGNAYHALITIGSRVFTKDLPAAYDQGYAMHLEELDGNRVRITVHSSTQPANPIVYLFVHTRGQTRNVQANFIADKATSFLLNKDSLDDGVSHLTIFDADKTPVCERIYFKPPDHRLLITVNPRTADSAATPTSYGTRQKIALDLATTDPVGHPVNANLSMSVFLLDSLQQIPDENILDYLLLSSDLKGRIESPGYYFTNSGAEVKETLDNLMLTQGWTRFRWEDILRNKKPFFEFLPEIGGPVITARVIDKNTGRPPSPLIGYLSVPGRYFKFSTAQSKPDGSIFFHVDKFYGNTEIIAQTNSATDSNSRIDIASPFSDRFSVRPIADSLYSLKWQSQLLARSINVQAENAYSTNKKYRFLPSDEDTIGFYGDGDRKYALDDYTRFTTMDEVIREYVEDVRVRRQSDKTYFRVRNALFNLFFEDDPLLLIDGVPVFNGDKMIDINPLKIEKIDVVSHKYYYGPLITDGLLSFRSYAGDLGGYQLDPNAVVVQYNGLQKEREFYSPTYENEAAVQSTIPDLRNQLLWSPEINTGLTGRNQLAFYTSDLSGKFALVVQGTTKEGLPGFTTLTFSVQAGVLRQ